MSLWSLLVACPSCPPALEARAAVFSDAFWINATYVVLPFALVGLVVHRIVKRLDDGARGANRDDE